MNAKKVEESLKKFWYLVWKDNSLKGWIFSIIIIFVFIKLIFFPLLSLVTGTSLPLAIVESCSMYHEGNLFSDYDKWWERHEGKYENFNINKTKFRDFRFTNGLNKGDILFLTGTSSENLGVGDIIVFTADQQYPVIHRIIDKEKEPGTGEYIFSTIGDNNNGQLEFEKNIKSNEIIGKAQLKLAPYLGWIKLIFFEGQRPNSERGFCDEN